MPFNHLVDFNDLTLNEWNDLEILTKDIIRNPKNYSDTCKGKLLATLFYEPSTRTMLSFQTAMMRLGGNVIGFDNPGNSSVSKGENLKDTISIISTYSDIVTMRHPFEGAALAASLYSKKPLINAGDGGHYHPTQTLADLFTISKEKNTLSCLSIGICGDLKHGRTVHSLLRALSLFGKNTYYLISTNVLRLPLYINEILKETGSTIYEVRTIEECIDKLDVLYMTRIQKERFASEEQYKEQSSKYILDSAKLKRARSDLSILHPLPRVDEISEDVDYDPRALYFKQAEHGMFIRMALIIKMLEAPSLKKPDIYKYDNISRKTVCPNPACITRSEKYLPAITYKLSGPRPGLACKYCDFRVT